MNARKQLHLTYPGNVTSGFTIGQIFGGCAAVEAVDYDADTNRTTVTAFKLTDPMRLLLEGGVR